MKKLTLSFWLALAMAGVFAAQSSGPLSTKARFDDPIPTCPPLCPDVRTGHTVAK